MQFDKGRFFQLFYSKLVGPVIRNCTVNCKTEVLTIGTSQTTTLERNEMHTLRILSRTHYTKVGMCMYIHCTRLRFLIR